MRLSETGHSTSVSSSLSAPCHPLPSPKRRLHLTTFTPPVPHISPPSDRTYCLVRAEGRSSFDATKGCRERAPKNCTLQPHKSNQTLADCSKDKSLGSVAVRGCIYSNFTPSTLAVICWHFFSFLLFFLALNVSCAKALVAAVDELPPPAGGHRMLEGLPTGSMDSVDKYGNDPKSRPYQPYHGGWIFNNGKKRASYELVMLGEAAMPPPSTPSNSVRLKGSATSTSRSRWRQSRATRPPFRMPQRDKAPSATLAARRSSPFSAPKFPGRQCKVFGEATFNTLCMRKPSAAANPLVSWRNGTRRTDRERVSWRNSHERAFYRRKLLELRDTYLAAKCASDGGDRMTLYDLFALNMATEADLVVQSKRRHLHEDYADCVSPDAPLKKCRGCFQLLLARVRDALTQNELFQNLVLSNVDCTTSNDVKIYSSISNCAQCRIWYFRWLLVTRVRTWDDRPCMEWCHLVELACPHIRPTLKVEFAGLPSFRCTDATIPARYLHNSTYGGRFYFGPTTLSPAPAAAEHPTASTSCVHPCNTWTSGVANFVFFDKYCSKHRPPDTQWTKKKLKIMKVSSSNSMTSSPSKTSKRRAPPEPLTSGATTTVPLGSVVRRQRRRRLRRRSNDCWTISFPAHGGKSVVFFVCTSAVVALRRLFWDF